MSVQPSIVESQSARRLPWWLVLVVGTFAFSLVIITACLRSPADRPFRWFSHLGFPDVAGRTYVKVTTGGWSQSGNEPPRGAFTRGFLLSQSNGTFTVFTEDLFVRTFHASAPGTPVHARVGFEPINLFTEASAYLELLKNPPKDPWGRFGQRLEERAEIFVLAWACERNRQPVLARQLFDQAWARRENVAPATNLLSSVIDPIKELLKRPQPQLDMIEQLERDIGHAMMWRAVVEFGETNLTRRELLGRFQEIPKKYALSPHREQAKETADRLARMIAEDDEHRIIGGTELARLPVEKRVGELIFQLRDQNGHQWGQPGWCDIFDDWRGVTNTPAHELVRIGYPAVPQLIAAVDDQTFTRSVGYHRDFYFSHTVLTVGDCAATILRRIAGKSFYAPVTTSGYMSTDGKGSATRRAAEEWWVEFQKKGEKQALIDATAQGDDDSPAQARLLFERYPSDAFAPVLRGAANANRDWTRRKLVEVAVRVPGDEATQFLSETMVKSRDLGTCVIAAHGLHERGRPEAVRAMIVEWSELGSANVPDDTSDVESLIKFLANSGRPEAIEALGVGLPDRPVGMRLSVVSALGEQGNHNIVTEGGFGLNASEKSDRQPTQSAEAAERLLVSALQDTEERMGMSGTWDDKSFEDPRVSDIAGHILWKRWPTKYQFDLGAHLKQRERQRIECINVSRVQNHLPPLPLPAPKHVAPIATAKIEPILQQIRAGKTPTQMTNAMRELESFGISALPATQKLVDEMSAQHPARVHLDALLKRFACTVTEIKLAENSLQPTAALVGMLNGLSNAPLSSGKFIDMLLAVANDSTGNSGGIELKALRDDDLTGVSIEIKLTSEKTKQAGSQKGWRTFERVTVKKDGLYNSSSSSSLAYVNTAEAYREFSTAIDKALAGEPSVPFIISAVFRREE